METFELWMDKKIPQNRKPHHHLQRQPRHQLHHMCGLAFLEAADKGIYMEVMKMTP